MIDKDTKFLRTTYGLSVGPWRVLCACTDLHFGAALDIKGNGASYILVLSPGGRKARLLKLPPNKRRAAK